MTCHGITVMLLKTAVLTLNMIVSFYTHWKWQIS